MFGRAFSLCLIAGCVQPKAMSDEAGELRSFGEPVAEMEIEQGYVQFVDHDGVPNTVRHLRGDMTVTVYEQWIAVRIPEDQSWHLIPRERVTYAGTWDMGP